MHELTKDVDVGGKQYQVGKMTAQVGCWIAMQLFTKMLPSAVENQVGLEGMPTARTQLSEEEFYNIQNHCLAVCKRYELVGEVKTAQPILHSGRMAFKDLDTDLLSVLGLTVHALIFNVKPFFEGDALKQLISSFGADLNLFSASK